MAEITRDALLARQADLAEQEKLAWANLNAVLGAMQDCEHWLAVLDVQPAEEAQVGDGWRDVLSKIPREAPG